MPFCVKIEDRFWNVEGENAVCPGIPFPKWHEKKEMEIASE